MMKRNTHISIPWWQPQITRDDYTYIKKVLNNGYVNEGEITAEFERKIASLLNVKYAIASSNGTSALFLALASLGIGRGDEVIIPDVAFIAAANAVSLTGANPVLVDINPHTLLLDPLTIEQAITEKTRAIIPVHISGRAVDMTGIQVIAKTYNLHIIEDACEAFFSSYNGKFLGTFGTAGCFSFSPNKTITTGQGGIVVTNNETVYKKVRELKDQGRSAPGTGGNDIHNSIGYNFRLTNLQAALGLGQLHSLSKRLKRQKEIYLLYKSFLAPLPEIRLFPCNINKGEIPLWTDSLAEQRDRVVEYLKEYNIDCRKFWFPLHSQTPYRLDDNKFPHSTQLSGMAVWLPSAFTLKDNDIIRVCTLIKKFYRMKHSI